MANVFVFLKDEYVLDATTCGIKLSEHADVELEIYGDKKKCLISYLNPNDYLKKDDEKCLLCEVADKYCFVFEAAMLVGNKPFDEAKFVESIIPYDKYKLGMYRKPRVAICATILGEAVHLQDKKLDIPMLYVNSEELYVDSIYEQLQDNNPNFKETVIALLCENESENKHKKYKISEDFVMYKSAQQNIIVNSKDISEVEDER